MSKAFVIKNKEGKYYKRYFDGGYVEFVDNFCFAELYTKKEDADDTKDFILRNKYRFNIENLEVVEVTIAEGDLEQQLAEKDKKINKLSEEHLEMFGDMKDYKNLWLAEQRKNKEIRKQVCDEIRELETRYRYDGEKVIEGYFIDKEKLDQIEQAKESIDEDRK